MLDTLYELCWHIGVEHPDVLTDRLTPKQVAGWIAWLQHRPRGDRRLDALMALQTSHLFRAWVEGEHDPKEFLPRWAAAKADNEPKNEAEQLFADYGKGVTGCSMI